jgi:hypothetical protein
MNKKQQFITEVQTAIIIWHTLKDKNKPANAMCFALIELNDAYYAADRIPAAMTAHEAACEYIKFRLEQNKESGYRPASWMMRK